MRPIYERPENRRHMPAEMVTMVGPMSTLDHPDASDQPDADRAAGMAWRAAFADSHDPEDVLEVISMAAFASGAEPFSRTVEVRRLPADIDFSAFGGRVVREYRSNRRTTT